MSAPRRGYDPSMLEQVAQVCEQVHGLESKPVAVAREFDCSPTKAHNLIGAARKAGHPIVKDFAVKFPPARLVCDCQRWSVPVEGGYPALLRHTLEAHERAPSTVERTPRPAQVAA